MQKSELTIVQQIKTYITYQVKIKGKKYPAQKLFPNGNKNTM